MPPGLRRRPAAELWLLCPAAIAASAALCYWLPGRLHIPGLHLGPAGARDPAAEALAAALRARSSIPIVLRYTRTLGGAEVPDGQLAETDPPATCSAPGVCSLRRLAGGKGGGYPRWVPTDDPRWSWPYNISEAADGPDPLQQRAPNMDTEKGPHRCIDRPRPLWRYLGSGNCTVIPFTAERFCAFMGNRSLLIVGDSLQHEQYMSLHFMLGGELHTLCAGGSGHCWRSRLYCSGRVNITYIRNDWLSAVPLFWYNAMGLRPDHIGYPWMEAATLFDIVVVLVAAHITPFWTGNDSHAHWQRRIDNAVAYFASPAFRGVVVARAQPGGHYGCPYHGPPEPLKRYQMLMHVTPKFTYLTRMKARIKKWRWDLYDDFNSYFRAKLRRALPASRRIWLDTATPSELRPDLHKGAPNDCLHYCLPGPPDNYNHMMLQALELHRCQYPEVWRRRPVAAPLEAVEQVMRQQVRREPRRLRRHNSTSDYPVWNWNLTGSNFSKPILPPALRSYKRLTTVLRKVKR
eukprot:TRINITY_DN27596_c0_g1_i1.p1 TRINITY_DN27596_c0_g1~~TRINITY_DN27596_c0_g1_i1.p1  ORF type:complete len:542 (+),score=147.64 TRINITY_DN27596_c0_g1_i1:74-1627(+)